MKEASSGNTRISRYKELGNLEVIQATDVVHSLPRHMHQTMCVGIIDTGARVCLHKGTKHTVVPGQVLVLNAGEVHTCSSAAGQPYSYRMICMPEDFLRNIFRQEAHSRSAFPASKDTVLHDRRLYDRIDSLIRRMACADSPMERDATVLLFADALLRFDDLAGGGRQSRREHQAVTLAREYLEERHAAAVSLSEIADLTNLSPHYLNRAFTRLVGMPPHAYQYLIRVRRAKVLLARSVPFTEVALETGFVDQSHFQKWFKKIVGITPGQYVTSLL